MGTPSLDCSAHRCPRLRREHRDLFAARFLLVAAALTLLFLAPASASSQTHRETVVFYLNLGPSYPDGAAFDRHHSGFHGGGGIGIPVSRSEPVSVEIIGRLGFTHFRTDPLDLRQSTVPQQDESNFFGASLEAKIRYRATRSLRPYATFGVGVQDLPGFNILPSMTVAGVGTDVAVGRSATFLLYTEFRYLSLERDNSTLCIDIGLRIQ